jgi:hypothetical protein
MIVLVLPGNKKVDWKQAAAGAKTKKVSFAKPEETCFKTLLPQMGQEKSGLDQKVWKAF